MSKKVLITRIIPSLAYELLTQAGFELSVWAGAGAMTQMQLIERAQQVDALISLGSNKIDSHFFNACGHLDIIAQFAVGYDNIDVEEATKRGYCFWFDDCCF